MAEYHVLGQILSAKQFQSTSIYCRFSFQAGPNWTVLSGCPEGQTVTAKSNNVDTFIWAQPLDVHFITKGIQGWPKLILQVGCLDSVGRSWNIGYSCCSLPTSPGYHRIQVPCWTPTATTLTDKIRQHFIGGSHQLLQSDIVNLGTDRYKLSTQSNGTITIEVETILRNFTQFGIEYK